MSKPDEKGSGKAATYTIKASNEAILNFFNNAENIIRYLTGKGERTRYVSALQRMKDFLEDNSHQRSIMKKLSFLDEKYAKTDPETGAFLYDGMGDKRSYIYEPEQRKNLRDASDEYLQEIKTFNLDFDPTISEEFLPKTKDGKVAVDNKLIKILCPFVITKETRDAIIYRVDSVSSPS